MPTLHCVIFKAKLMTMAKIYIEKGHTNLLISEIPEIPDLTFRVCAEVLNRILKRRFVKF